MRGRARDAGAAARRAVRPGGRPGGVRMAARAAPSSRVARWASSRTTWCGRSCSPTRVGATEPPWDALLAADLHRAARADRRRIGARAAAAADGRALRHAAAADQRRLLRLVRAGRGAGGSRGGSRRGAGSSTLVERHEGAASADLARAWWRAQRSAFQVFRGPRRDPFRLPRPPRHRRGRCPAEPADPAVAAARAFVEGHGPVARGEGVVHLRWWMHADAYQAVTAAINLTAMHVVSHCITRPGIAWNFVAMARPGLLGRAFRRA